MADKKMTGQCLCGAVKFTATPDKAEIGACHCGMCRRWAGGPYMVTDVGGNIEFENKDKLKTFRSSEWAERGFCSECGTSLFYKLVGKEHYMITAAALDDFDAPMTHEVFIDDKPSGYEFAGEHTRLTGKQVFEMFQGGDD